MTPALACNIDEIAAGEKLLPADWQKRLPHDSSPHTSTIVLMVRKGKPKGIKDWDDLAPQGPRPHSKDCGKCCRLFSAQRAGVTRQSVFDRSSATIRAPRGSTLTPTGRPRALPSAPRKPHAKSIGAPAGRPSRNGTNTTL